jgi:heat shock protein HspQ
VAGSRPPKDQPWYHVLATGSTCETGRCTDGGPGLRA